MKVKFQHWALLGIAAGSAALGVALAGDPAADKARAQQLFHEAWQLTESARVHHGISVRLVDTAGVEEEAADNERHKARHLEFEARQLEKGGDQNRTKAAVLRGFAQKAGEKAEWDESQANALRNRIARDEAARRDQQQAAEKLSAAAKLEVDVGERGRLSIEASLISGQASDDGNADGARRQRLQSIENEARALRQQAVRWLEEAHRLDPSDGRLPIQPPAGSPERMRAHEMFREAWRLAEAAKVHHGAAVRMLDGSSAEEEIADRERHRAHDMEREARQLERDGNADRTKAALLRDWARKAEEKAELDECQERSLTGRIARDDAARRDQQEAANKLAAAAQAETDGNEKGRLNVEVSLIQQQAQEDASAENDRKQRLAGLQQEVQGLRAQAAKWREEAHRLDPSNG